MKADLESWDNCLDDAYFKLKRAQFLFSLFLGVVLN